MQTILQSDKHGKWEYFRVSLQEIQRCRGCAFLTKVENYENLADGGLGTNKIPLS